MKTLLLYVWQLPQHVLALALMRIWKPYDRAVFRDCTVYRVSRPGIGVSLGRYIFLDASCDGNDVCHEWGHTRQSLMLGPLYLPVVGFASAVCNNLWDRLFHRRWPAEKRTAWYYGRFPEKQADRLGGVERV